MPPETILDGYKQEGPVAAALVVLPRKNTTEVVAIKIKPPTLLPESDIHPALIMDVLRVIRILFHFLTQAPDVAAHDCGSGGE
ncbi:MAG: hypothetical protein MUO77_07355 [Anaerolineales bacterium]|nr:hypothetical protein [Anaerolineales bacterium]